MSLPREFLEEVRSRLQLSDVIGRRVKVTRAGREFKACCPFHHEKTPSFTINDEKGFYHCFGCGAHGDVIGFLMQHDNMSFMDAVESLARDAGLQVPRQSPEEVEKFRRQGNLQSVMDMAMRWFKEQLASARNREALQYLKDRGLSDEIIAAWHLGYAPAEGEALPAWLKAQGVADEAMIELGLARPSKHQGKGLYSFFRDRVMFPVMDRRGRVVAFGGRVLPESYGGKKPQDGNAPPKYINSSDHPLFHKGQMLYGLSQARHAAAEGKPLIVVEGYMDVISLSQAGFRGAVAPLGTALTEAQVMELWKAMPPELDVAPVLCFDGDGAGQRAARRALERIFPILRPGRTVRFAFLPEGEDPDSLVRSAGRQALQKVIDAAIPLNVMLWQVETAGKDFITPEALAGLKARLLARVNAIADRDVQMFYQRDMDARLSGLFGAGGNSRGSGGGIAGREGGRGNNSDYGSGRPPMTARQGGRSGQNDRGAGMGGAAGAHPVRINPVRPAVTLREKILLAVVVNHPALFHEFGERLGMAEFRTPSLDKLRQDIIYIMGHHAGLDSDGLKQELFRRGHAHAVEDILTEKTYAHAGFARPGCPVEDARAGWEDAWQRGAPALRMAGDQAHA